MADNKKNFRCHDCEEDYPNGMALARHFVKFPEHRNHRQQVQFVNSQKVLKKRRRETGIKRSSMYGRVRQKRNGKAKRVRVDGRTGKGNVDKVYPCETCNRNLGSATHAFKHFQTFPHHRNEKQQQDYERNLGYAEGRVPGNGGLPTLKKATRKKKAPALEINFCTTCGTPRGPGWTFCGGCGTNLTT